MKLVRLGGAFLLALLLGLAVGAMVSAQAALTVTPGEMAVFLTRNRGAVITRTLFLRSTVPITNVQVTALDLERVDGQAALPATRIRPTRPITSLAADSALSLPILLDLRSVPSGEFKGELLVSYHGGTVTVPLTVRIKDAPFWPLVVLFLGVGLGIAVSVYRVQGRPRDQVLVRMGQVRTEAQVDGELAPSFRTAIMADLVETESALQAKRWSAAERAMERAEGTWLRWRKDRSVWIEQLAYARELLDSEELDGESRYLRAVARGIRGAIRDAPVLDGGPKELNQSLDLFSDQLTRYLELRSKIENLNRHVRLASVQRTELAGFQNQLDATLPSEEDKLARLEAAVEQSRDRAVREIAESDQAEGARGVLPLFPSLPLPVPALRPPGAGAEAGEKATAPSAARKRLAWFTRIGYVIAIVLLVGVGFGQLYVAQPTFGSSLWRDYFALLLWGFGAEASRAALTEVLRSLEVLGIE